MTMELIPGPNYGSQGTFTPILTFGGASVGITYTTQTGLYRKDAGNLIFIFINIALSSKGSSTGDAIITGLPFPASDAVFAVAISQFNSLAATVTTQSIAPISGSSVLMRRFEAGAIFSLTDADFTNTSIIRITGFYPI